jgi:hypothetical protein
VKKRKKPTERKEPTESIVVRGVTELARQAQALADRCQQPDGTVLCTINLPITVRFLVSSADERDRIIKVVQESISRQTELHSWTSPDADQQYWIEQSRRI